MNTRQRLERKQERREDWAAGREQKAAAAFKQSDMSESASGIPFGQPILVGHHSEGRHRKVIAKAHAAMGRAVESSNMAEHHRDKAANIQRTLDRSIFSDEDNAIEEIEKRIAARDAERKQNTAINKIIRRKPKHESTPEKVEELGKLGIGEVTAALLFVPDCCGRIGIPSYVNANLGGNISSDKKRIASIKARMKKQEAAEESENGISIIERNGWCVVTFADKPEREVILALKAANFRWSQGSWMGSREKLPEVIEA